MAVFGALKKLANFWRKVRTPQTFSSSAMFKATKKIVYKAAYEAGVRVGEFAQFLKEQGAKNIPDNIKSDVDQYYRQLANYDAISKVPKNELIPSELFTREHMRRQRRLRYIVEGSKLDTGSGKITKSTFSFWVQDEITLEELERKVNEQRATIDNYDGAIQQYQLDHAIAVVINTNYKEPNKSL